MKIKLSSVVVDNQEKALKFYTEVLSFVKRIDIPIWEARWLTVVSPEGPDDKDFENEKAECSISYGTDEDGRSNNRRIQ